MLVGVGLLIGLVLLIVAIMFAAMDPRCLTEIKSVVRSGSGKYVAVVDVVNCGATTAYNTGVVVSETAPDGSASGDLNKKVEVLSAETLIAVALDWGPDDDLLLTYEDKKVYYRRTEPWRDVTFRYATRQLSER